MRQAGLACTRPLVRSSAVDPTACPVAHPAAFLQATVDFLDMIIDRQATTSLGPHQHFTLPGQSVWQGEVSLQLCINIQGMVSEHCDWRSVQHGYLRGVLGECGFGACHRSV